MVHSFSPYKPLLWLLTLLLSSWSHADTPATSQATASTPALQLTPFRAYYTAVYDMGLDFEGEAVRELKPLGDDQWQLSMRVDATIAKMDETSRFRLQQGQLQAQSYSYSRKVLGKKRKQELSFDWQLQQATSRYKDKNTTLEVSPGTVDRASYQLLLGRDLHAGVTPMEYQLAYKGRLESHRFVRMGEESIETPAGRFDCIKVTRQRDDDSGRQTYIWFAKDQDQLIVKLEQIERKGKKYAIHLERLETN